MKAHDLTTARSACCLAAALGGILLASFAKPASASETAPVFSPYLAVDSAKAPELTADAAGRQHLKAVTLAFLGRAGKCKVGWRGLHKALPYDLMADGKTTVLDRVEALQKQGVEIILSFGGWMGADPAGQCDDPAALQAVYQQVLDRYHVKSLDFDVEGPYVMDLAAHKQRNQALLALKRANPDLTISFTLPVRPHGIPKGNGLEVLQSAAELGYSPEIVSLMTMDYFVDPGSSTLYRLTERAMDNAARQIKDLGLSSKLGVIPMIGQNDNRSETFTLDDARNLMRYVRGHPDIVRTSLWSLERDNGGCAGNEKATDTCSGVAQDDSAFSQTLSQFR